MDKEELQARVESIPYWYHKISLPHGVKTNGWSPLNPDAYSIPERMDGEKVLDIGAWDGYWTFEALKRGAKHVTAIEDFSDQCGERINADRSDEWNTMRLCAEALGYQCKDAYLSEYLMNTTHIITVNRSVEADKIDDSCDDAIDWVGLNYDRVFCFGVLYHLRNPLKALQNCFEALAPGGTIHIETAILDNITSVYTGKPHDPEGCYAEFYPTNQFGMNASNWWVPTMKCAAAWLQAAGFVDIEQWKLTDTPKNLAECRGFFKARKE